MKMLWQLQQNLKIWHCQSRSYQGQVKIIQHVGKIISVVLSKYELNPSINENGMTKENWKNWPCWWRSYKGQGQTKITQHVELVIIVGLSKY